MKIIIKTLGLLFGFALSQVGAVLLLIPFNPMNGMDPVAYVELLTSSQSGLILILSSLIIIGTYVLLKAKPVRFKGEGSARFTGHGGTDTWSLATKMMAVGILLNIAISIVLTLVIDMLPVEMIESYAESTSSLAVDEGLTAFLAVLLGGGILGPIAEELVFRHSLINLMLKKRDSKLAKVAAVIISSALFGIAHGNLIQGTYTFVLGCIFGFIYLNSDNGILYNSIVHISLNSASIVGYYLGLSSIGLIIFASTVLIGMCLIKKNKKQEVPYAQH